MLSGDAKDLLERVRDNRALRTAPVLLELDLTEGVVEAPPRDPLAALLSRHQLVLRDLVEKLRRAATDPRVRGLVVKLGRGATAMASTQEIRDAVLGLRQAGKPTVAWAETFGEFGPGTMQYYLATAFEQIWLQPSGDVGLTGVSAQALFVRGALDKLGVTVQIGQRHEYKNAANMFTERGFTEAHREGLERIVTSAMDQVVAGVAEARGLDAEQVRALADRGPISGTQALEAGLVDQLGYRDEVYDAVRDRVGPDTKLLFLTRYRRPDKPAAAGQAGDDSTGNALVRRLRGIQTATTAPRPAVALVYATGQIRQGRSGRGPGGSWVGSDTISAGIRAAVADEQVKAIVLRVDSPGGSYIASDTVWREVVLARRAGTPVVASMGNTAASGGYFISMAADRIVASPGTLTGSIGVLGGKQSIPTLLERVGVDHDSVAAGAHAEMYSSLRPFDEDEWGLVNAWLDRVYEDFTAKVAQSRGLDRAQVHEVARGRVWTGADALEHRLVDELGGLRRAVELAGDLAGLPADREPEIRVLPRFSPLDRVLPPQSSEDPAAAAAQLRLAAWGPLARAAARLGLPDAGPLTVPPEYHLHW